MVELTHQPIETHLLADRVRRNHCGAVVLFLGTVRDVTGDEVTVALEYQAYAPMAEKKMREIEGEIRSRFPVGDILMVHRLGRMEVGEVAVAVVVSSPHRKEAFEACSQAMDRLKEVVPIWKKDSAPNGATQWVHPAEPSPSEGSR
jgi:molybdopterin synthase catalytic subunit